MDLTNAWMNVFSVALPKLGEFLGQPPAWIAVIILAVLLGFIVQRIVSSLGYRSGVVMPLLSLAVRPISGTLVVLAGLALSVGVVIMSIDADKTEEPRLAIATQTTSQQARATGMATQPTEKINTLLAEDLVVAADAVAEEDPVKAVDLYEQARNQDPDNPEIWFALGTLYDRLDGIETAVAAFEMARDLASDQKADDWAARAESKLAQLNTAEPQKLAQGPVSEAAHVSVLTDKAGKVTANLFEVALAESLRAAAAIPCPANPNPAIYLTGAGLGPSLEPAFPLPCQQQASVEDDASLNSSDVLRHLVEDQPHLTMNALLADLTAPLNSQGEQGGEPDMALFVRAALGFGSVSQHTPSSRALIPSALGFSRDGRKAVVKDDLGALELLPSAPVSSAVPPEGL